jgi:restriction system protein
VLTRGSETTVVQAKHWRSDRVGVQLVRELYGVQRAMNVERSMFVALGQYTGDAERFADKVGMTLIDGEQLLKIIGAGLAGESLPRSASRDSDIPTCPACGQEMVRRTARRGGHAGEDFWGCSAFPVCRATVSIAPEAGVR